MNPKKESIKDQLYREILQMIISGELTPREIFTEGSLIEHFKVSKSPVREALIQLCHEGVLKSIPRCGYQVIVLDAGYIHEIAELRILLECWGLERAMRIRQEPLLKELRRISAEREQLLQENDVWKKWYNNVNFHLTLNRYAQNSRIYETLERALAACTRAYAQLNNASYPVNPMRNEQYPGRHEQIMDLMEKGDCEGAKKILRDDICCMEQYLLTGS